MNRKIKKKALISLTSLAVLLLFVMSVQTPLSGKLPYVGPALDESWIYWMSESAQVDAMIAGSIDVMRDVTQRLSYERLEQQGFTLGSTPSPVINFLIVNCRREPMNDERFRQAIAHLYPADEVVPLAYGGLGIVPNAWMPDYYGNWVNHDVNLYSYDPALAAFLLDEAGYELNAEGTTRTYPNGTDLQPLIIYGVPDLVSDYMVIERYVGEMEAVKIPIDFRSTDFANYQQIIVITHEFDMTAGNWGIDSPRRALWMNFHSTGFTNFGGFSNPTIDAILDTMLVSLNETESMELAHEAQLLISDACYLMPLSYSGQVSAYNADMMGITHTFFSYSPPDLHQWRTGTPSEARRDYKVSFSYEPTTIHPLTTAGPPQFIFERLGISYQGVRRSPFTSVLTPLTFSKWEYTTFEFEPEVTGQATHIWIEPGVYWHDGVEYTTDDIAFCLQYVIDKGIAPGWPSYVTAQLLNVTVINKYECILYHKITNPEMVESLNLLIPRLPKHIWNDNTTRYGQPAGLPPDTYSGQVGYGVQTPMDFLPWEVDNPNQTAAPPGVTLTCLVGIGEWILPKGGYVPGTSGHVHLVANRNYHWTYSILDLNVDFKINIIDISMCAKLFGTGMGQERYTLNVDINDDGAINIVDITLVAVSFGESW